MNACTPGQSLSRLERDLIDALCRPDDDDTIDMLCLYLDLDLPIAAPVRAAANRLLARHDDGGATLEDEALLLLLELVAAAQPTAPQPFARYAAAHARARGDGDFGRGIEARFTNVVARTLAQGASIVAVGQIVAGTHGDERACASLCRYWRSIAANRNDPGLLPGLLVAARVYARSEAMGMLSCLALPAVRERLGRTLWVQSYPTLCALVEGWSHAAPGDPALLEALGAVTAKEAAVLARIAAAIRSLLSMSGAARLTMDAIYSHPELGAAIASAHQTLPELSNFVVYAHAIPSSSGSTAMDAEGSAGVSSRDAAGALPKPAATVGTGPS